MVKKRERQRSMPGDDGQMAYWPILMGGSPQEDMPPDTPPDTAHQDRPVEPPAGDEKPDVALMTRHPYTAAFGDRTATSVAAGFGPFVVLLGQHRAHQAPRRQPVGEDAHHVPFRGQALRRLISRFSRSCGLLDHSFCQWATGKAVQARMSGAASASSSATWAKGSRSCSTTRSNWPWTSAGDSCW